MSKAKIITVATICLVLVVGLMALAAGLGGGLGPVQSRGASDGSGAQTGSWTFDADLTRISVDVISYDVFIQPEDVSDIEVEVYTQAASRASTKVTVKEAGNTLSVTQTSSSRWDWGILEDLFTSGVQDGIGHVIIRVPRQWNGRTVRLNTVNGELQVRLADVDELNLDTVSGRVDCEVSSAERTNVDTVSGRVDLTGRFAELYVDTVSGRVDVKSQGPLRFKADSVSGNVALSTDQRQVTVAFESISGRLNVDDGIQALDGQDTRCTVDTISGGFEVSYRPS